MKVNIIPYPPTYILSSTNKYLPVPFPLFLWSLKCRDDHRWNRFGHETRTFQSIHHGCLVFAYSLPKGWPVDVLRQALPCARSGQTVHDGKMMPSAVYRRRQATADRVYAAPYSWLR